MDKKNTILGILFIALGIGFMFWQARQLQEQQQRRLLEEQAAREQQEEAADGGADQGRETGSGTGGAGADPAEASGGDESAESAEGEGDEEMLDLLAREVAAEEAEEAGGEKPVETPAPATSREEVEEERVTLSNAHIEVQFTTLGGAIRKVAFLQTKRGGRDDYVFNKSGDRAALSLSLAGRDGAMREFRLPYEIESRTDSSITFRLDTGDGLRILRSYSLVPEGSGESGGKDPYVIRHTTAFANQAETGKALSMIYFNLGTSRAITDNEQSNFLNVGYFDGNDATFIDIRKLIGSSGFLGIGANEPTDEIRRAGRMEWASVKNQFFASVLSSPTVGRELVVHPVRASEDGGTGENEDPGPSRNGITGNIGYELDTLPPGEGEELEFDFYIGPKEFKRLQALGNEQDLVMQFGFLGFFSKLLLAFMYGIHFVIPSWGWSIVIMTFLIKLLFWPLTAKASRSQKRMSKIQGPMAELKEKYKDNPQKMQQETLKLFKQHQVNPVAGCLPILIQMPIFLGLFYMLRTASELRHEPFLWVSDLSRPDTIMEIGGFPLNLLPLIMAGTMFLQMSMMPVSPTADPAQQKIFKFLPFLFLLFLYNFSSGLVLYWTVQNILTIVQQKIINSQPDEEPAPVAEGAGSGGESKGKGKSPPGPRKKSKKKPPKK